MSVSHAVGCGFMLRLGNNKEHEAWYKLPPCLTRRCMKRVEDKSIFLAPGKNKCNRMNIYACILNMEVPHEVRNQHAVAMRTAQIMEKM